MATGVAEYRLVAIDPAAAGTGHVWSPLERVTGRDAAAVSRCWLIVFLGDGSCTRSSLRIGRRAEYSGAMSRTADQLLREVLALSPKERAELVIEVLDSLEPPLSGEQRTDDAWIAEVERRARAALAGSPGISWDEARARIRLPSR